MTSPGKRTRALPETVAAIQRLRPELLQHGISWAISALAHEALGIVPPPTPHELKAAGAVNATISREKRRKS